jgi:hypothetical protein
MTATSQSENTLTFVCRLITFPIALISTVLACMLFFTWYVWPPLLLVSGFLAHLVYEYRLNIPFDIAVGFLSIFCAWLGFLFKRARLLLYGHFEVLFGIAAIILSIYQARTPQGVEISKLGVGFFAGIYIIIRGLSNIDSANQNSTSQEKEPALSLKSYFRSVCDEILSPIFYTDR